MPNYTHHIFICCNERDAEHPRGCCKAGGGEQIRAVMKDEIARLRLRKSARANKAGCLDRCEHGPAVVVYPEGVWYTVPDEAAALRIVREHVLEGKVVEDLLMRAPDAHNE